MLKHILFYSILQLGHTSRQKGFPVYVLNYLQRARTSGCASARVHVPAPVMENARALTRTPTHALACFNSCACPSAQKPPEQT